MLYLKTLSNYGRSQSTAVGFCETLSETNQNKVIRHPIEQSKIDLTKLQTDKLIPT